VPSLIADGLKILVNLTHRGACGCDETTGDGAGILMQMPHRFLSKACAAAAIGLPDDNQYACGLVFLPPDQKQRRTCMDVYLMGTSELPAKGGGDLPRI